MERICENCGQPFVPKRSDAAYCSHSCRQLAYLARKGTAEPIVLGEIAKGPSKQNESLIERRPLPQNEDHLEKTPNTYVPDEVQKEYESNFLSHIELRLAVRNREAFLTVFEASYPAKAQWLNTRLLCLVESLLCMSEMKFVALDELKDICNAFHFLLNSENFENMSFYNPYTDEMVKYYENLKLFCSSSQDEEVTVRFTRTTKAELLAARFELAQFVAWVKFYQLDFSE